MEILYAYDGHGRRTGIIIPFRLWKQDKPIGIRPDERC